MATSTSMPKWDFACWTRGHPSSLHRGSAVGLTGGRPRARSQRRAAAPRATWAASGTAGVRREAGLGRRRDAWPVLRPSRTFKRRQPAARPRILHTRRHDQAERARCRVLVRAACEGRLWPQQVHQTDLKACRRRAVVARARDRCRGAECSGEPEATWVTKWWILPILSRAVLWWGCV